MTITAEDIVEKFWLKYKEADKCEDQDEYILQFHDLQTQIIKYGQQMFKQGIKAEKAGLGHIVDINKT